MLLRFLGVSLLDESESNWGTTDALYQEGTVATALGMAAGLATGGKIPFPSTFANFATEENVALFEAVFPHEPMTGDTGETA